MLQQVAARLLEAVRATDTAARFGGDEFAILIEDVGDPATAIDFAERLVRGFEMPISVSGKDLSVRPSIGIALSGTDAEEAPSDADELIRNADAAMYICKRDGSGGYRVFEAAMHERVLERLELRAELQRAIEARQFELHFQPVVRLHDGTRRRHGGARPLASPDARARPARAVHPAGRGDGPDRRPGTLGAAGVVPARGAAARHRRGRTGLHASP